MAFQGSKVTRAVAKARCAGLGGKLVTLNDKATNDIFSKWAVQPSASSEWWFGLAIDFSKRSSFTCADFVWDSTGQTPTWTNWQAQVVSTGGSSPGEPPFTWRVIQPEELCAKRDNLCAAAVKAVANPLVGNHGDLAWDVVESFLSFAACDNEYAFACELPWGRG
jgi:hypothetical protein